MRILFVPMMMAATSTLFAAQITEHRLHGELQNRMVYGANGIVVDVRNDHVVLQGDVLTLSDKALAEATVAKATELAVVNELSINDPHLRDGF